MSGFPSKKLLAAAAVAGIVLALMSILILPFHLSIRMNLASLLGQPTVALPVRLKIPKIKLDTSLEYVSITSDGSLGTPKNITHAAWFSLGPRPGEEGNAIIDGHYGWKNGQAAVFNNLSSLKVGDKIYTEDKAGNIITFVVRQIHTYDKNEDASGVFGLSDGKAHLNLITCEGVWIPAQKTYSNRLVIFTDRE